MIALDQSGGGSSLFTRLLACGTMLAAASLGTPSPARAEFFTFEQLRSMCRGEVESAGQFRTGAAYALLAQTHRDRCRMYLLGLADAYLQSRPVREEEAHCIVEEMPEDTAADLLAEALIRRSDVPAGGAGEVVRDVLRTDFGCE